MQLLRIRQLGREVLVHGTQRPAATPEASVNWPIDSVEDRNGAVLGVVIPKIPDSFFLPRDAPRSLDFLHFARAQPPPPDASIRVSVLIRVAEIFAWLDRHDLVHGDFSDKNIVWRAAPEPGAYLIDCDWLHSKRPPPTHGTVTPGWIDPRLLDGMISAHDHYSDWYALALAIYRGLSLTPGWLGERLDDGTWPKPAALPTHLHPQVRALLEQTLGNATEPRARAKPAQWVSVLRSSFVKANGFNNTALTELDAYADRFRSRYQPRTPAAAVMWSGRPGSWRGAGTSTASRRPQAASPPRPNPAPTPPQVPPSPPPAGPIPVSSGPLSAPPPPAAAGAHPAPDSGASAAVPRRTREPISNLLADFFGSAVLIFAPGLIGALVASIWAVYSFDPKGTQGDLHPYGRAILYLWAIGLVTSAAACAASWVFDSAAWLRGEKERAIEGPDWQQTVWVAAGLAPTLLVFVPYIFRHGPSDGVPLWFWFVGPVSLSLGHMGALCFRKRDDPMLQTLIVVSAVVAGFAMYALTLAHANSNQYSAGVRVRLASTGTSYASGGVGAPVGGLVIGRPPCCGRYG
jgi:hypothetical protein